jgi:TolB-like protein
MKINMPDKAILIQIVILIFSLFLGAAHSQNPDASTKLNIAVTNFKSGEGITEGESSVISDRFRVELFKTGGVNVMERDQMQDILKEQGFQASGACTDEACLIKMGELLGVHAIVGGSIGKVGSLYLVNLRLIDVQTGKITRVVSKDIKGDIEDVVAELDDIAKDLVSALELPKPAEDQQSTKEIAPATLPPIEKAEESQTKPSLEVANPKDPTGKMGVRISADYYIGGIMSFWYDSASKNFKGDSIAADRWYLDSFKTWGYQTRFDRLQMRLQVDAVFNPWKHLLLTLGAGFLYGFENRHKFKDDTSSYLWEADTSLAISSVNITGGIGYIKRFKRLFLEAEALVDINGWTMVFNRDYRYVDYTSTTRDSSSGKEQIQGFAFGAGPRIALGYMFNKRIAIHSDVQYRFFRIESTDFYSDTERKKRYLLPGLGVGLGADIYLR